MTDHQKNNVLPAKEIAIKEFNTLRGRLCSVIESMGLDERQERAVVLLVKGLSYQSQAVVSELIDKLEPGDKQLFRYMDEKLNANP